MRRVILSKRTSIKLDKLLNYIEFKWSEKVKQEFIAKLDKSIEKVRDFPESTEKSEIKKGLHRCVVTNQTTFYYQFDDTTIKIVTLFASRMNPQRLKKETDEKNDK